MHFFRDTHVILIILLVFIVKSSLLGQTVSLEVDSGIKHARDVYFEAKGRNSSLYSGYRYKSKTINPQDEGHPFFLINDWINGSITHDGITYSNVNLLYDVVYDKIVVQNAFNFLKVELLNDRVANFSLVGRYFVNLSGQEVAGGIQPGFYDLLYDGQVKVCAKRTKEIIERLESGLVITKFKAIDKYFIFKEGRYFQVKSKSSVLEVFEDQKAEMKGFLAQRRFNFKKDREKAMASMARFYDEGKE